MPSSTELSINKSEKSREYRAELSLILDKPLTPETIDTYADNALNDLIKLVENAISTFSHRHDNEFDSKRDLETTAFRHFGLGDVESILDHIADVSDRIHFIDTVIDSAIECDIVTIPPSRNEGFIPPGDGSFEKVGKFPRLKTALFVLENDFNVDISDPELLTKGKVTPSMIRNEPYWSINVPKLERTILVCDEGENVTYVFDQSVMSELGITNDDLLNMSKQDLNDFVTEHQLLGSRLVYSNHFVSRLVDRINDPSTSEKSDENESPERSYLYPKAPPDIFSVTHTAKELGVGSKPQKIRLAITALGEDMGTISLYDFGGYGVGAPGLTSEQRLAIEQYLITNYLLAEKAPDNVRSLSRFASRLHVKKNVVEDAIASLGDSFGEVKKYRFYTRTSPGINVVQRRMVYEYLKAKKKLAPKATPDDHSENSFAAELGIDRSTVIRAVEKFKKEIGEEELGETPLRRFGATITKSLNPEQQSKLWGLLEFNDLLAEPAPESYKSTIMISKETGIPINNINKAIEKLKNDNTLGEVKTHKHGRGPSASYDQHQSELIIQRAIGGYIQKT